MAIMPDAEWFLPLTGHEEPDWNTAPPDPDAAAPDPGPVAEARPLPPPGCFGPILRI